VLHRSAFANSFVRLSIDRLIFFVSPFSDTQIWDRTLAKTEKLTPSRKGAKIWLMAFDGSVIAILWESTVNTKGRQAGGKTQTASPGITLLARLFQKQLADSQIVIDSGNE
jgi:hypothetical protein